MQVILLENINKLGAKYELKEVSDGYARNHLIPQGLARPADEAALKWAREQKEKMVEKAAQDLEKVGETASRLEGMEVELAVKVGDEGQLFEKVTGPKIASRLNEMGYNIKKDQVEIAEPIKDIGEFDARVVFEHNLEAQIKVIVTEAVDN